MSVGRADSSELRVRVEVVESVVQYMAGEMRRNAVHPATAEVARLNAEAATIYDAHLSGAVAATVRTPSGVPPVTRRALGDQVLTPLDLATASTIRPRSPAHRALDAVVDGAEVRGAPPRLALDYVASRFRAVGAHRAVPYLDRYHELKQEAFMAWGAKVRPDPSLTWQDRLLRRGFDASYGDGDWDHKPPISEAWGELNRLGNDPVAYGYDVWSNVHYGFVGRAAGFSLEELTWGADVAQWLHKGAGDDARDAQGVQEGFGLHATHPRSITWQELAAIGGSYGASWGRTIHARRQTR